MRSQRVTKSRAICCSLRGSMLAKRLATDIAEVHGTTCHNKTTGHAPFVSLHSRPFSAVTPHPQPSNNIFSPLTGTKIRQIDTFLIVTYGSLPISEDPIVIVGCQFWFYQTLTSMKACFLCGGNSELLVCQSFRNGCRNGVCEDCLSLRSHCQVTTADANGGKFLCPPCFAEEEGNSQPYRVSANHNLTQSLISVQGLYDMVDTASKNQNHL